jgi:DinB superfamily
MKQFLESSEFLQTVLTEAEKNSERARLLAAKLTEDQLNWKPAQDKWSMAQCLEHLTVTSAAFDRYFTAAIEQARKRHSVTQNPRYQPSFVGGWLARQVDPETGRKLPAPKIFRPADASHIQSAVDKFINQQERFSAFVRQSEGVDYNKTRLRSPVTPLMRYSLADAFVITVLHGRRHLGQAQRVREMPHFPAT